MNQAKTKPRVSRLRQQLKAAGITVRRVAREAGVGEPHCSNVLAGRHRSARVVETARRLLAEATSGNGRAQVAAGSAASEAPTQE